MEFNYEAAFDRNVGLLSKEEQQKIRNFTIALPGMGGVGGAHLISLVRQGFERFKIADNDTYVIQNFNRQYGAMLEHIGKHKADVMRSEALRINPTCSIEVYKDGINEENIDQFLSGVDLVVDGLDAFALNARIMLFRRAQQKKIPLITAGPFGFSVGFAALLPQGPRFDDYFNIKDSMSDIEKLISLYVGVVPSMLHRSYIQGVNLKEKRGPSSVAGIDLCAGMATTYALKILLRRGRIRALPYTHQFDAYKEKYVVTKLRFGNKSPLQRLKIKLALRMFA